MRGSKNSANTGTDQIFLLFVGRSLLRIFGGKLRMQEPTLLVVVSDLFAMAALRSLLLNLMLLDLRVMVRIGFRIFHLSTDKSNDRISSPFWCGWLFAVGTVYVPSQSSTNLVDQQRRPIDQRDELMTGPAQSSTSHFAIPVINK